MVASYYIEQRFDMFLSNYIECETLAANLVIDLTVRGGKFWENTDLARSQADRLVTNLLMSSTAYKAQVERYGSKNSKANIKKIFENLQAGSWPFRAITEIRNYAQHFSLPVHGMSLHHCWTSKEPKHNGKQRKHTVELYMDIAELAPGLKRSPSLLSEFEQNADEDGKLFLLPLLRSFVEDVSTGHAAVRKLIADDENIAASELKAVRSLASANGTAEEYLMLYELSDDDNGKTIEAETFLGARVEINLAALKSRNRVPLTGFGLVTFAT